MLQEIHTKLRSLSILLGAIILTVTMVSANDTIFIYHDDLSSQWENHSLLATVNFESPAPVHEGTHAISVTYNQGLAAFYLEATSSIDVEPYQGMRFWLHGGEHGGHQLNVTVVDAQNQPLRAPFAVTSQANTWVEVEIPFDRILATMISGIVWQDTSGQAQAPFFIDDIEFIASQTAPPPPDEPDLAFSESFDGEPDHPQAWNSTNWDITTHSRDHDTWLALESMQADHGANCEAPPSTHPISAYEDAVFQCKNHMMTALNAEGYGAIYLTPDHMVDFSEKEAVIRFDMSTARKSPRDWIDLWITPYDHHLQLPLDEWLPDLNGEPQESVHISMDFSSNSRFKAEVVRNFDAEVLPRTIEGWKGYEYLFDPSQKNRETFELRISDTHIKFGLPEHDFWWVDTDIASLGWQKAVVQFGHHSYNPAKGCDGCGPNTWHWDNINIEPALPFTMIAGERRYVDKDTDATVHFATPAPENAHLRFAGIGNNIEVSVDGGSTWQSAALQAQEKQADEKFRSYWMPIPAGTTDVRFRGEKWWGAGWHVRDISIWSPDVENTP